MIIFIYTEVSKVLLMIILNFSASEKLFLFIIVCFIYFAVLNLSVVKIASLNSCITALALKI